MKPRLYASRFLRARNVDDGGLNKERQDLCVQRMEEEEEEEEVYTLTTSTSHLLLSASLSMVP